MKPYDERRNLNLGRHVQPQLPPGTISRSFRIAADERTLDAFHALSPTARGRVLERAMKGG